ncbi:MYND-type domain-containing protein [Mycena venus]|uniref:MYND-type domain-containing protein n=1 Tax=Mycena venus TaxID=2733690 RepID=A0A8H6YSC9_9AGAR|nr:MYND-type domain-containing protein [Mycena venus]
MALALSSQVHPDLRLEKLARLPPDLRRLAKTAANGSLESLKRLERPVRESPEGRKLLFLPVFFANLDPASIPAPDDVDTTEPSPDVVSTLMRAYISLQALESYPDLPEDLYPIIWERVWTWTDFLDQYYFCLGHSQHANRVHFLQKIWQFRSQETASHLVDSTYGVWTMVGQMWSLCVERNGFARGFAGAGVVGQFIAGPIAAAHLNELVDAIGGTQRDLAAVVVKHLTLVTCDPHNPLAPSNLYHLQSLLIFLGKTIHHGLLAREAFGHSSGLPKALVESACALARISGVEAADALRRVWNLLRWAVTENVLHLWMPSAVRCGLLRAIVACATHNPPAIDIPDFRQILTRDLPPSLVYYHVLNRMGKALCDVKTVDLRGTAISDEWTAFVDLANVRLGVLRTFRSDSHVMSRVCDNVKCGIIDQRKRFRVCSICRRRYYCSEDCQRIDWTEGGHKAGCDVLYTDRVEHPEELSTRSVSFLRALLHHDYTAMRREVWLQQILFMHAHQHRHPSTSNSNFKSDFDFYTTHFDYSRGAAQIQIHSLPQIQVQPDGHSNNNTIPQRAKNVGSLRITQAQVAASAGRMELHYMFFSAGSTARTRLFPMRSNGAGAELRKRLAEIARGFRVEDGAVNGVEEADSAEMMRKRQQLIEEEIRKVDEELWGGRWCRYTSWTKRWYALTCWTGLDVG